MDEFWRMLYRETADAVVELHTSYSVLGCQLCQSPKEFVSNQLNDSKRFTPETIANIAELVAGLDRYYDVLFALLLGYCDGFKRNKQADSEAMCFIAYLCLYRYGELSATDIASLVSKITLSIRVQEFVDFLTNEDMLIRYAAPHLVRVVQDAYVEDFVIPTLVENGPVLRAAILGEAAVESGGVRNEDNDQNDNVDYIGENEGFLMQRDPLSLEKEETGYDEKKRAKGRGFNAKKTNCNANSLLDRKEKPMVDVMKLPPYEVREMVAMIPESMQENAITAAVWRHDHSPAAVVQISIPSNTRVVRFQQKHQQPTRVKPFNFDSRPSLSGKKKDSEQTRQRITDDVDCSLFLPHHSLLSTEEEIHARMQITADQVEYRNTTAALLREHMQIRQQRLHEESLLATKLATLRDDREFQQWRVEGMAADERLRLEQVHERKLSAMLADEEARQAKSKQQMINARMVCQLNKKRAAQRREHDKRKTQEHKQLCLKAVELRGRLARDVTHAVKSNMAAKLNTAVRMKDEMRRMGDELAQQTEAEMQYKKVLIKQIKDAQSAEARLAREAYRKAAEAAAATEEMVVGELRMLLQELQRKNEEELAEKRQRIISDKNKTRGELAVVEQEVLQHRAQVRAQRDSERMRQREEAEEIAQRNEDVQARRLMELQARMVAKKEERERLQAQYDEEDRRRTLNAQLLRGNVGAVERARLAEMERAQERVDIQTQNAYLKARKVQKKIRANAAAQRQVNLINVQSDVARAIDRSDREFHIKKAIVEAEKTIKKPVRKGLMQNIGS